MELKTIWAIGIVVAFAIIVLKGMREYMESPETQEFEDKITNFIRSYNLTQLLMALVILVVILSSWLFVIFYYLYTLCTELNRKLSHNVILPKDYNVVVIYKDKYRNYTGSYLAQSLSNSLDENVVFLEKITLEDKSVVFIFALPENTKRDYNSKSLLFGFQYLSDITWNEDEMKNYPKRIKKYLEQEYYLGYE